MKPPLSRRGFLATTAGVGAGVALTGCGDFKPRPARLANANAKLPTYIQYKGVPTTMPATKDGVSAGYRHFPSEPARAFPDGPPAKGPGITVMNLIFNPVPPPAGRNTMWQALNKYVGCDINFQITPVNDYPQKFAVVLAGGDLPDAMLMLPPDQNSAATPDMLDILFEDLSPHLSGDNIRDYPYLANIPTDSWRPCVRNGGIYAIPMPRPVSGGPVYTRLDLFKKKDVDPDPRTWREFVQVCKDMTDHKAHQYALGDPTTTWNLLMQMQGAPNWWREENGRFTHYYETEECRQALDAGLQLKKAGVMHPDAFNVKGTFKDWFGTGKIVMHPDAPGAWNDLYTTYAPISKGLDIGYMLPPDWDASTPGGQWQGRANYATLIIKKAPKPRIQQILRALNALAAPFGTDGYLLRKYGVRGPDHTVKGPDPILTPKGTAEVTLPTIFATDSPFTLYYPQKPEIVPTQYAFQKEAVKQLIPNPAEALYSATDAKMSKVFGARFDSLKLGIMAGRNGLGEWDGMVKEWRTKAGDKMRAEYEQAWGARQS